MKTYLWLLILFVFTLPATAGFCTEEVGSLQWTLHTGGALTDWEKLAYVPDGLPSLFKGYFAAYIYPRERPSKADLSELAPPNTDIVNEARRIWSQANDIPLMNHCYRTAYWTLVVMKSYKPDLTPKEIEEAWVAALMHDIGFEPGHIAPLGEFTLGGVTEVHRLAHKWNWNKDSEQKASEAITLNPNGHVDRKLFGLLAWAMNIGGFGETYYGPYRVLMNPENIRELEALYPRGGLHDLIPKIVDEDLKRFPNQRFAILNKIKFIHFFRRPD